MADKRKDRKKEIEELSLEELKKKIKKDKKKVAQNTVFIIAAAFALIALCIAWFVSNNRVSGTSGTVSAKYSGIEIGSEGQAGVHDDLLQGIKNGITSYFPKEKKEYDTSQYGSINWMLSENSNMNNYKNGGSFEETTGAEYRKEYAMEPGTKGKLDFFIKTYEAGDLSLNFSLDISPFHIETDKPVTVGNDTVEAGLLSGHILYFLREKQPDGKIAYTWIKDGKFKIEIQNAEKAKKYNYSIYWVWPLNLSTILLNKGDSFLNENTVEFDDKDSTGKLRNTIVTDMKKYPNKYFFSSLTGQPLDTDYAEVKEISNIHEKSGKNNDEYDKQLFVDLSSYYNQADMKIGAGISFVTATLRYLETAGTTNKTTEAQNER